MAERGLKCALSVRVDFEFAPMKYLFSAQSCVMMTAASGQHTRGARRRQPGGGGPASAAAAARWVAAGWRLAAG